MMILLPIMMFLAIASLFIVPVMENNKFRENCNALAKKGDEVKIEIPKSPYAESLINSSRKNECWINGEKQKIEPSI